MPYKSVQKRGIFFWYSFLSFKLTDFWCWIKAFVEFCPLHYGDIFQSFDLSKLHVTCLPPLVVFRHCQLWPGELISLVYNYCRDTDSSWVRVQVGKTILSLVRNSEYTYSPSTGKHKLESLIKAGIL
jgi:hypothetical protein